jgi:hypothetical protein
MSNFRVFRQAAFIVLFVLTWATMISLVGADKPELATWENLNRVKIGNVIKVVLTGAKSYQSTYQSFTDEEILMLQESGMQHISRKDILRISAKLPEHRRRNALIGFASGAAVELGVGAIVDSASKKTGFGPDVPAGMIIGSTLGVLGGTLVGVFCPTGGWQEIYRR